MWCSACLLFESVKQTDEPSLWEESLILIQADSLCEAEEKALGIGKKQETRYQSATGDDVRWKFRGVERVFEITDAEIADGTELFSRFLRPEEVASLLKPFE